MKTTARPNRPRMFYALHWPAGVGVKSIENEDPWVEVYAFWFAADRDAACAEYRAPDYCPTAYLQPALASDPNVARAVLNDKFKIV